MKSRVEDRYLRVVGGVFKDISLAYPQLRDDLAVDFARLSRNVASRGMDVFLVLLPSVDKALLSVLETGALSGDFAFSRRVSSSDQRPRFMRGLWSRIIDAGGLIHDDVESFAVAALRQVCSIGKKADLPCTRQATERTLNEYIQTEEELRRPTLDWAGDRIFSDTSVLENVSFTDICDGVSIGHHTGADTEAVPSLFDLRPVEGPEPSQRVKTLLCNLQRICDTFAGSLGTFFPQSTLCGVADVPFGGFRHGRGATAEGNNRVDKFSQPNWPNKLRQSFGTHWAPNYDQQQFVNHEPPSVVLAVPKDARGPRLIAKEPTNHMWCQQALRTWIERNMAFPREFINFRRQDLSQEMVARCSIDKSLATVDLKSASDRISCWAVERMLRKAPSLLQAIHSARTRWAYVAYPDRRRVYVKLRKCFTQGTAVTFPMQSLFFLMCVFASSGASDYHQAVKLSRGRVRVFGDDIIVPRHWYADLVELLTVLQLRVNLDKSFVAGYFRESCGFDAYRGDNVTPVKITSLDPTTPPGRASIVDTANNLFTKGWWYAAEAVGSLDRNRHKRPVSWIRDGGHGYLSFSGQDYTHLKMRWDPALQRVEYACKVFSSEEERLDRDGRSRLALNHWAKPFLMDQFHSDRLGTTTDQEVGEWVALPHRKVWERYAA